LTQTDAVRLYRRTLALLMWGRGSSVTAIAMMLQVQRQSLYNWLASYTSTSDPTCLRDALRSGRPPRWTSHTETLLADAIALTPDQLGYLAVTWTVPLLQDHLEGISTTRFSDDTIRRALHRLGYVWKRYRYVLDEDEDLEKKRHIRAQLRALPARSVVLAQDETDLLLFAPLRSGWAGRGEAAEVRLSGWNAREVIFGALKSENWSSAVSGALPSAGERLSSISRIDPSSLSCLAGDNACGRRSQPYSEDKCGGSETSEYEIDLAAQACAQAEPDGHTVGPSQRCSMCQQTVCLLG
jgi:transposase